MKINFLKDQHKRETLHLAWPLIVTQVGHILTGMVDNIFLGRIGVAEQAAGILSNNLYVVVMVFAIGVSYATTPLVTTAHENGDLLKKASLFKNSLFLNLLVATVCFVALYHLSPYLKYMRQPDDVINLAEPFFDVLIISMIPISLFFACKQYCEGLGNTRMALVISVTGNIINIILNYVLIYGKFGFPELGYMGAAWASFCARLFMGVSFLILVFRAPVTREISAVFKSVKINLGDLLRLWKIGFNAAMQFTFEVAAFVIAGLMAGTFGKEQLDAHGIALNIAAFTYMFASGIASAATIRVGVYNAQNSVDGVRKAARSSIELALLFMGVFGLIFLITHNYLPIAFSTETKIIELSAGLLIIAAMFQLFDGLQVTIIGILRGLEDVKVPTVIALVGYWLIALPLAYLLAFTLKLETPGIWIALLCALAFVAVTLYFRLKYVVRKLAEKSLKIV